MNARTGAATVLIVLGSIAILIGVIDPVEGMFAIFPGSGMIAVGAYLAQTPHRRLVYCAFLLIGVSFCASLGISSKFHGLPGWWTLVLLPYPIGWIMDVVGVPFTLTGLFKGPWVRFAVALWVLIAVALLTVLITTIIRVDLLSPWAIAGVIALSCACTFGVYASDSAQS